MFEWLNEEIGRIKTPKFHLVDGPASVEFRQAVESSDFPLPPSYREFVLRFGNANLYRRGSYYMVHVYAGPRMAESKKSEALIHFGHAQTSLAYFKESLLTANEDSPVFEWRHNFGLRKAADGFEDWLKTKCKSARKRFKKMEWEALEKGPDRFYEARTSDRRSSQEV